MTREQCVHELKAGNFHEWRHSWGETPAMAAVRMLSVDHRRHGYRESEDGSQLTCVCGASIMTTMEQDMLTHWCDKHVYCGVS